MNQFIPYFEARSIPFSVVNDVIFFKNGYLTQSFCAANQTSFLPKPEIDLLLKAQKTYLFRAATGFENPDGNSGGNSDYYTVIAKKNIDVQLLKSDKRRKFNKANNIFEVRRIEPSRILGSDGVAVTQAALQRYGKTDFGAAELKKRVRTDENFGEIVHYWGVFEQEKLVAYCWNHIFGNTEANYSTIRFLPSAFKNYVAYALFYKMNQFYLEQNGFEYVNDGFRSLTQHSDIQQFLVRELGFEYAPTRLVFGCNRWLGIGLGLVSPFSKMIKNEKFQAVRLAQSIAKNQTAQK